ncbi:MAG: hypothetical protein JJU03_12685 [Idiomarina sp.]|nr:hypothetical protein [Idiomarina sp.]
MPIYLVPLFIFTILALVYYAMQQQKQLNKIQQQLDTLLHFSNVPDSYANIDSETWAAIRKGQRSEAVRSFKKAQGCSMIEAQKVIRELFPRVQS